MALSQEIAKLFQGELKVESKLGKGSRFVLEFPAKEVIGQLKDEEVTGLSIDNELLTSQRATRLA